jgi:hypothetical protein
MWAPSPVWSVAGNLPLTGIRSLDSLAHNISLYRLSHSGRLRYFGLYIKHLVHSLEKFNFSHYKNSTTRFAVTTLFPYEICSWAVLPSDTLVYEAASQPILLILSIYFSSYTH